MSLPRKLTITLAAVTAMLGIGAAVFLSQPGPIGNASGPACDLLKSETVDQALGLNGASSREEKPLSIGGGTVHTCTYVVAELFGRGGYATAWLYVATYPVDTN